MSCIRFNTASMRKQQAEAALHAPIMQHPAPEVTPSKIARLRLMATDKNPKIRERVALDRHTPEGVREALSKDPNTGVRACVARNETTSCDLLRVLATDDSEVVRGFVALNYFVPDDVMPVLAVDSSATVRGLVSWKTQLTERTE